MPWFGSVFSQPFEHIWIEVAINKLIDKFTPVYWTAWECFRDAKVKGFFHGDEPIERERLLNELKTLPDGARAGIIWTWSDRDRSHIIACEKLGGQLLFVDPQKGTVDPSNLGRADKAIGYTLFRADNLEMKADFEWREIIRKK